MQATFTGIKHILLDIDGTLVPLSFAKDVLFPTVAKELTTTLQSQWSTPAFQSYKLAFPESVRGSIETFEAHTRDLIRDSSKISYWKDLQGYLIVALFQSGDLTTPFFDDVYTALEQWKRDGIYVSIYSAGSIDAQHALFQYAADRTRNEAKATVDLRGYLTEYFDTSRAGVKTERESYIKIAEILGEKSEKVLFLSDALIELEPAREAGMQVCLARRPGNLAVTEGDIQVVDSCGELQLLPGPKEDTGTVKNNGGTKRKKAIASQSARHDIHRGEELDADGVGSADRFGKSRADNSTGNTAPSQKRKRLEKVSEDKQAVLRRSQRIRG